MLGNLGNGRFTGREQICGLRAFLWHGVEHATRFRGVRGHLRTVTERIGLGRRDVRFDHRGRFGCGWLSRQWIASDVRTVVVRLGFRLVRSIGCGRLSFRCTRSVIGAGLSGGLKEALPENEPTDPEQQRDCKKGDRDLFGESSLLLFITPTGSVTFFGNLRDFLGPINGLTRVVGLIGYFLVATLSFALLDRGFIRISAGVGRTGFFVVASHRSSSRNAFLTMRSSSE